MVACSYKRIEAISTSQLRKDLCGSFVSKLCRKKDWNNNEYLCSENR